MFVETELARREIQRASEKLLKPTKHTMIEPDMVVPSKKEIEKNHFAEGVLLRNLTDGEKQILRSIGMTSSNIERCKVDERGVFYLDCQNSDLEGTQHPATGVCFERKMISINGVHIEGVFPEFQSVKDFYLPERLLTASENEQFRYLNAKLREAINMDPQLRAEFTEQQIQMIEKGYKPTGYTWHHNESSGVMQLVETATHAKTGHTGGDSIWCGR